MFTGSQHNDRGGGGSGLLPRTCRVDRSDRNGLLEELYTELRARAGQLMRGQPRDLTLQATALVHEACEKLLAQGHLKDADRTHLLALASRAMCCVLVDHARSRGRIKRQPPGERVPMDDLQVAFEERAVDLVALDEALAELAEFDPEMARVVDLHFFAGLSFQSIAQDLGVPQRTLERRWAATRSWLRAEIG
jgi:RNA polymerase sigma factor (TIGR02999 family)